MEQIKGLSNIGTVVSYVLDDMEAQDKIDQYGEKIAQLAIRGFIDMNIHYSPTNIKVVYLRVNNLRVVNLPVDYVDYTKIGININGNIWTLSCNPNMALDRATCCNLDIREVVSGDGNYPGDIGGYYFAPHYFKGNYVGGLWGAGGGWNSAYYRVDKEMQRIQFDGVFPQNCQIVLEYKSTGVDFTTQTIIPRQYVEPLVAYIHMKLSDRSGRKITNYDKEKLEQRYINEMEKLSMFNNSFTVDEILDVLYANFTQLPKR